MLCRHSAVCIDECVGDWAWTEKDQRCADAWRAVCSTYGGSHGELNGFSGEWGGSARDAGWDRHVQALAVGRERLKAGEEAKNLRGNERIRAFLNFQKRVGFHERTPCSKRKYCRRSKLIQIFSGSAVSRPSIAFSQSDQTAPTHSPSESLRPPT